MGAGRYGRRVTAGPGVARSLTSAARRENREVGTTRTVGAKSSGPACLPVWRPARTTQRPYRTQAATPSVSAPSSHGRRGPSQQRAIRYTSRSGHTAEARSAAVRGVRTPDTLPLWPRSWALPICGLASTCLFRIATSVPAVLHTAGAGQPADVSRNRRRGDVAGRRTPLRGQKTALQRPRHRPESGSR